MKPYPLLLSLTALLLLTACTADPAVVAQPAAPAGKALPAQATVVDMKDVLIPPPGFPVRDDAYITEVGKGFSKLTRRTDGATVDVQVMDQPAGHVQVFYTVIFNYPEYCREPDDRFPETSPCSANGAADRRDGLIPEVQFSIETWAYDVVGRNGKSTFRVDLSNDAPLENFAGGPGLVNPRGAVIGTGVMDKGPLAPEGPLREMQTQTLFGGCQGPPAFGPLPCKLVEAALHQP